MTGAFSRKTIDYDEEQWAQLQLVTTTAEGIEFSAQRLPALRLERVNSIDVHCSFSHTIFFKWNARDLPICFVSINNQSTDLHAWNAVEENVPE